MNGPLCGVAVVAFVAVRCGAADILLSVHRLAWGTLRCSGFWLYESLAHWLVAAQLCERNRWLPRSGVVTIMKLLLLAVFCASRPAAIGQKRPVCLINKSVPMSPFPSFPSWCFWEWLGYRYHEHLGVESRAWDIDIHHADLEGTGFKHHCR